MTCKELRWYFEDHLRDAEVRSARGAVAEHAATCADCSRFVAEQRELGRNLRKIRESVGPVPQSLDASVLFNYRGQMAEQSPPHRTTIIGRLHPNLVWGFAALAATILVVAGFLLRSRPETTETAAQSTPALTNTISVTETRGNRTPERSRRAKPKATSAKRAQPSASAHAANLPMRTFRAMPEGFRSLMYCDELSCPQNMEMIRVQLPSSAMPRQVSSFIQTSGSVTADVLVGPDGIARGIRFEEIEF